ncbi:CYTH and CHAD domain-containing protein [Polymorphospora rubra]|uniref:CHAD domain-containing protein n=1 Tax=Polymorphospora rubra TaxID=338584 RepID=A0A810N2U2_9ACTN|nr:CYTH and CHAD domain-containing protein [Polymorphospora rubra]BCJ66924.1 CHAD domain-containing protein [Polymorphospora rubra]
MLEEERKYEADPAYAVPDLAPALPDGGRVVELPPATLTATYLDTPDLRLARAGASLRHRKGDPSPWTVKFPADLPGRRHEVSRPGRPGRVPAELSALVTAYSRGTELARVAVVRTVRRAYELRDADGRLLAEVADDAVSVLDGRRVRATFREIEVERGDGDTELLDRVEAVLCGAGARAGGFTPKLVRALGSAARDEPDLVAPAGLPDEPTAGDVVTDAVRKHIRRILAHDPLVRLRLPVGDDTAVHQMRVGCRRLRSDLRTFRPLTKSSWSRALRDEVKWLADALGGPRDAEVLRARLRRTAAGDPLSPLDEAAVARIDRVLAARQDAALAALDEVLASDRYAALVEDLVAATREPRLTKRAGRPAADVLPRLVAKPWRRLVFGADGVGGAGELGPTDPDERWHATRIDGKKARYAVNAVKPVVGAPARDLGKALSKVQDLLGEHQDAALAAEAWLSVADEHPADHALAVTAGRLAERERQIIHRVRAEFPQRWSEAVDPRRTEWLP